MVLALGEAMMGNNTGITAEEEQLNYLLSLLNKHGVCITCGEMYSHDIEAPFASCNCKTAEWHKLTPYMKLEKAINMRDASIMVLQTKLEEVSYMRVLPNR